MANSGGGVVAFGVSDDGKLVGCFDDVAKLLDPASITSKMRRYSPTARIETICVGFDYQGNGFCFLCIKAADKVIVFDSNCSVPKESSPKHQEQIFGRGIVYIRGSGGNTEASQFDLTELIDRISEQRVKRFVARIEQVAALPNETELIARHPSSPDSGYLLQGKGTGIPVRITDHPDALPVSVVETIDPEAPFSSLDAEIAGQVRHWKQGDPTHSVNRPTLIRWYLSRNDLNIDDDAAEFALLSSGRNHGYPMYWASVMSTARLTEALARELREPSYPMIEVLPHLVGCFCWEDRKELLKDLAKGRLGYIIATRKAKHVLGAKIATDI